MSHLRLTLLSLCLSLPLLLPPGQPAWALDNGFLLGTDELQKVFLDLTASNSSLAKGDLEVSNFTATPAAIDLPAGALDFQLISGNQAKALGQQVIVTDVLVDGVVQGRIKLSGDLALFGEVVCTSRTLPRHSIIRAENLKRVRRNLTVLGPDLITDEAQAIGKEVKTTLQAGAILYNNILKEPEMVKRGDIVSILAATDFITITVPGRVQKAGAKGDLVKVKNLMSRREIFAKVVGPGTVQAEF